MRLRRKRPGLSRRALNVYLATVLPDSIQCYAFQFGSDPRWTACTALHNDDGAIMAWTSTETYATQWEALQMAYWHARQIVPLPTCRDFQRN